MKPALFLASAAVMLAGAYLGGYFTNLDEGYSYASSGIAEPIYHSAGDFAKVFYWPAFQLDRRIRPERWPDDSLPPSRMGTTGRGFNHQVDRIHATCLNPAVPSRP